MEKSFLPVSQRLSQLEILDIPATMSFLVANVLSNIV